MRNSIKTIAVFSGIIFLTAGIVFALIVTVNPFGYFESEGSSESNEELNQEIAVSFEDKAEFSPAEIENKVVDMVHRMSHQKVRAEEKWGHLKITEERINEVIGLLEQYNVEDRTFLHKEMLNWRDGNFSNSEKVHNVLTQPEYKHVMQSGKAYGLLSKAEEQDYIEKHFTETDDIPKEEDERYQNRN
ncbi:DUF6241 domain-containing protein [Salinicoccus carnicancri]|uniref:DUF6241 domain-containing protein n=1 Tax=Salinicoccus carnicancri TaxID=558170 RepID=UPI00030474AF|nr:DUF6241 domain-containing protein [Salinicoccus carnicancri]